MEEPRWNSGAEEYRAVQALVRDGRFREAVERGEQALQTGFLGRKHAARINSLLCWILTEPLQEPGPAAALHGEEAVRLALLVNDLWIKCEALSRLVHTYCRMGHLDRAAAACSEIAAELAQNPVVLDGGSAAYWMLKAMIAAAGGDDSQCLEALDRAQEAADPDSAYPIRIRIQKASILLAKGCPGEARALLDHGAPGDIGFSETVLHRAILRAWLILEEEGPEEAAFLIDEALDLARAADDPAALAECIMIQARAKESGDLDQARHLARLAFSRAVSAGRVDLTRRYRRLTGHLLG